VPFPSDITTITVTGTYTDVEGNDASGTVTFAPTSTLTDTSGEVIFTQAPITLTLASGAFSVLLPCTDNEAVRPTPFEYLVTVAVPYASQAPFAVSVPSTLGPSVDLSALWPIPVPAQPVNGIYVISVNGQSGSAQVAPYNLPGTGAATRYAGATTSGHPASGVFAAGDYVVDQTGVFWICVAPGTPGTWAEVGGAGGGGIDPPAGDIGGSAALPTVVSTHLAAALPLAQGGTGQASAQAAMNALAQGVTSGRYLRGDGTNVLLAPISAADVPVLNQSTTGTASNITDTLDQVPAPAANVSLNSYKITNLANGSASGDAAAFGQIPAALPPSGSAGGSLAGTYPSPSLAATAVSAGSYAYAGFTVGADGRLTAAASGAAPLPLAGGTMTGWLAPAVVALSQSGGLVAVNAALGNVFTLTLTASGWTISNPANPVDGQVIRLRLAQDSAGSRTVSWDTAYDWGSASGSANPAPTLTSTASKTDVLAFEYVATTGRWCSLGAAFPQGY
jgi:hypothetical protein